MQLAEINDVIKLRVDVLRRVAEDSAVQIDVLPRGQIHVKAGTQLDKRCDGAVDRDAARAGLIHAGNDFQQCRLAAAVQPNQAVEVTGHNIKRYIVQGEEFIKPDTAVQQRHKVFLETLMLFLGEVEAHRNMVDRDNGFLLCHFDAPLTCTGRTCPDIF